MNPTSQRARPPATAGSPTKSNPPNVSPGIGAVNLDPQAVALLTEIRDILVLIHNLEIEKLHQRRSTNCALP